MLLVLLLEQEMVSFQKVRSIRYNYWLLSCTFSVYWLQGHTKAVAPAFVQEVFLYTSFQGDPERSRCYLQRRIFISNLGVLTA